MQDKTRTLVSRNKILAQMGGMWTLAKAKDGLVQKKNGLQKVDFCLEQHLQTIKNQYFKTFFIMV